MTSKRHIHQYRRVKLKTSVVFRCMLPDCTHYTREAFIINKKAICPYCGKEFLITADLARRKNVHCFECTKGKKEFVGSSMGFLKELSNDENAKIADTEYIYKDRGEKG